VGEGGDGHRREAVVGEPGEGIPYPSIGAMAFRQCSAASVLNFLVFSKTINFFSIPARQFIAAASAGRLPETTSGTGANVTRPDQVDRLTTQVTAHISAHLSGCDVLVNRILHLSAPSPAAVAHEFSAQLLHANCETEPKAGDNSGRNGKIV
jgi:hypothetical protein